MSTLEAIAHALALWERAEVAGALLELQCALFRRVKASAQNL